MSPTATTPDVISRFVSYYVENVLSGRCGDEQLGLAFMLDKGGYMFVAVDPDPSIEQDPTALAPRDRYAVLAHAVFRPNRGRVRFRTPGAQDGNAPAQFELEDPVYIEFQHAGQQQLWILSLNRLHASGEPLQVHRADPSTLCLKRTGVMPVTNRSLH